MIKTENEILGILKKHSPKVVETVYTEDASSAKKEKIDYLEMAVKTSEFTKDKSVTSNNEVKYVATAFEKIIDEQIKSGSINKSNGVGTFVIGSVTILDELDNIKQSKIMESSDLKVFMANRLDDLCNELTKRYKAVDPKWSHVRIDMDNKGKYKVSIYMSKAINEESEKKEEAIVEATTTPEQQEAIKNLEDVMIAALIDATDGPGGVAVESSVEKIYQEMMDLAESFLDEVQDAGGDMEYCSDCIDELFKRLGKKLQQADFSHYEAN